MPSNPLEHPRRVDAGNRRRPPGRGLRCKTRAGTRPTSSPPATSTPRVSRLGDARAAIDLVERRAVEVEHVHAHLGAPRARQVEADGLHARHPSARLAHAGRDLARDLHVVGRQLDVVGDERSAARRRGPHPCAGRAGAGRRPARSSPASTRRVELVEPSASGRTPVAVHLPPRRRGRPGKPELGAETSRRPRAPRPTPARGPPRTSGTSGTTSTAPTRGCTPSCSRRSTSSTARAAPRDERVDELLLRRRQREHRPVVVGVRVHVEEARAAREYARPIASIDRGVTPFGDVRHGLEHDPYPTRA